ncbi:chemotaxis protein CheW [Lichenicola cladoniae]|uniref:Chemotaxis protein CheW n=1 Tax=Lichenicola cladoniae TaxID=1484109 RepID=A0A6M8HN23_9PROT|nr:chemotaxis protein CheW [Lichenicola cladoniae]NPD67231.1 chemotaxis protein CheW [Acetobacteraceae bacterium]QKE89742.1 chemotaxis protein CheW [Lichenicola cladoniae]
MSFQADKIRSSDRNHGGNEAPDDDRQEQGFVTLILGGQLCGVPVLAVREVITNSKIVRVPLAPPEIAGNINLRGRVVTTIDTRCRLGLEPAADTADCVALVAEHEGVLYALLIDQVQDVLSLRVDMIEETPPNFSPTWREFSNGVFRLPNHLMVVLDIGRLLALPT